VKSKKKQLANDEWRFVAVLPLTEKSVKSKKKQLANDE